MGNLLNFAIYNPAILSDEDFLAGFIARNGQVDSLLQSLKRLEPDGAPKHRLIIGQRGMGKTSLLRRIALGIEQDDALAALLLPLSFREEQYNVHNLHVFWLNCLNSLADYFDRQGRSDDAVAVDNSISQLETDAVDSEGEAAYREFKAWCKREQKRPLLLLDNIDIILEGLAKQDWAFRRILQERGGPVVFGATVHALEATAKIEAAFYDFFQVTVLDKLSFDELLRCLRQLAERRGTDGIKVKNALNRDPARIHTLYDFTGGNPRTLTLLYLLLELDPEDDVMGDLERLLDQVSVLYKARVEDLAPQARVVLDAIALAWNPVALTEIKKLTGLENSAISPQLDRLQKNGVIEKTSLSATRSAGYQLGERLFNIWYLMRHGQRRQRNRLRWLSEFLRGFYQPHSLRDLAQGMVKQAGRNAWSQGQYCLALRDAIDEPALQRLLGHHATSGFESHADTVRSAVQELVDFDELDGSTHTMTELKKAVLACEREWPEGCPADVFWALLGGSIDLTQPQKTQIVEQLPAATTEQVKALCEELRKNIVAEVGFWELPTVNEQLRTGLRNGLVRDVTDLLGIAAAVQQGDDPRLFLMACRRCNDNDIKALPVAELDRLMQCLKPLMFNDNPIQNNINVWRQYCRVLVISEDYQTAEQACRVAIKHNANNTDLWNNLGNLLQAHLQHYEEAEQAYREAIRLDVNNAYPWNGLGNLLQAHLQRYEEAEQAYREAIRLDTTDAYPWNGLGNLLQGHLQRYEEAEQAYRQAIRLDANYARPWYNLGLLLQDHLQRYEEAEQTYREAIRLDANNADPWSGLGNVLADYLGKPKEAEQAYKNGLELDPNDIVVKANLAYLLLDQNRQAEAEPYYQAVVSELPDYAGALLCAYREFCLDNAGTALGALAEALGADGQDLFSVYFDDLLRVLRLAAQRGYGNKVLDWLDSSGLGERYWPLRAAYDAYLHGETKLRDINPEVRNAASGIFASLQRLCR